MEQHFGVKPRVRILPHLQERRTSWYFLRGDGSRPVRVGTARCLGLSTWAQLVLYRQHSAAQANHSPGEYACHCVLHSQPTAPATGADQERRRAGVPHVCVQALRNGSPTWTAQELGPSRHACALLSRQGDRGHYPPWCESMQEGRDGAHARKEPEWPRFSGRRRASCTRNGSGPPDASTRLPTSYKKVRSYRVSALGRTGARQSSLSCNRSIL